MSPPRRTLLTYAFVGLFALLSAGRLLAAGSVPWGVAVAVAAIAALLVGPASWFARARIDSDRRAVIGRIGVVVGLASFPLWFGIALAFGVPILPAADAAVLGTAFGAGVALVAERTALPERYRARNA